MVVQGEGHFAGGAVAVDVEQGGACLQIEVAGQAVGVGALEAGAELAADAVACVHQRGGRCGRGACFERGGDVCHAVITVKGFGEAVGHVVGGRQCVDGAGVGHIFGAALVDVAGDAVCAVEHLDGLSAQLGEQRCGNEDVAKDLCVAQAVDGAAEFGEFGALAVALGLGCGLQVAGQGMSHSVGALVGQREREQAAGVAHDGIDGDDACGGWLVE